MKSLREWAEYYQNMRVWVYPYNYFEDGWKYWRNRNDKDYANISKTFKWEDEVAGIKMIVGKKGIRLLTLDKSERLLNTALELLGLPSEYPWIVETNNSYSVIIDSTEFQLGNVHVLFYSWGVLLIEGSYVLPSPGNDIYFYQNRKPLKHPTPQVKSELILRCAEKLSELEKPAKISFAENIPWWRKTLDYILKFINLKCKEEKLMK